jgi:hypothetical protein
MGTNVEVFTRQLTERLEQILGDGSGDCGSRTLCDRIKKVKSDRTKEKLSQHPFFLNGTPVILVGLTQCLTGEPTDPPITAHIMSISEAEAAIDFWV